ncbi:hypothetical protein FOFC_17962 [Fusarium oxysporum]|nr:hypothetical protein FOFC_17962 [Fusarium oxysporum]
MANKVQASCRRYKWVLRMSLPGRLRHPDNHITKASWTFGPGVAGLRSPALMLDHRELADVLYSSRFSIEGHINRP